MVTEAAVVDVARLMSAWLPAAGCMWVDMGRWKHHVLITSNHSESLFEMINMSDSEMGSTAR